MTKHRTLAEAYAANAADCAQHGHSWIAEHPGGPRTHCSWCGARRTSPIIEAAREEREAAERVKAAIQSPGPVVGLWTEEAAQ